DSLWSEAIPVDTRLRDASHEGVFPHQLDEQSRGVRAYRHFCRIWNKRRRPVSKADVKPVVLHNHVDGVLQDYLDQLLVTATVSPAVQAVPVVTPAPVVAEAPQASSVV